MTVENWYRIDLPYAVFAIVVVSGKVIDAAPIARWTMGKKIEDVLWYYKRRSASIQALP